MSASEPGAGASVAGTATIGGTVYDVLVSLTPRPPPPPPVTYGPRVAVGPAEPFGPVETQLWSVGVAPVAKTSASIQFAISVAQAGSKVVKLPAGIYTIDRSLMVPSGVTVLGEGAGTVLQLSTADVEAFFVTGPGVRFSRFALLGGGQTWTTTNRSRGIQNVGPALTGGGYNDVRIDHLEISGCCYGLLLSNGSARVEACHIHHSLVASMGYGINIGKGAWGLFTDCLFHDCRAPIASGGEGTRKTHWEAINCAVTGEAAVPSGLQQCGYDAHGGMDGDFVIEGNLWTNLILAGDFGDGRGWIKDSRVADCGNGLKVWAKTSNQITGKPHDYEASNVLMERVGTPYQWLPGCVNCRVDGVLVPSTVVGTAPGPPPMPRLSVNAAGGIELK